MGDDDRSNPPAGTGWRLPAERDGRTAPENLIARRAAIAAQPSLYPSPPTIEIVRREIAGIACTDLTPARARGTLLYLHGGGFRMGGGPIWEGFGAQIATRAGVRIIMPDYRLAPEQPFPAALHDAAALWDVLTTDGMPIMLGGDSAGGGLAAALALAAADSSRPRPSALLLLSPWLDLSLGASSFDSNRLVDRLFPHESAVEAAEQYLQGYPADDPLVSPLFGQLHAMPEALLIVGGHETLLADATRFADRLALAGSPVDLLIAAGKQHVWPLSEPDCPETERAIERMAAFLRRHRG